MFHFIHCKINENYMFYININLFIIIHLCSLLQKSDVLLENQARLASCATAQCPARCSATPQCDRCHGGIPGGIHGGSPPWSGSQGLTLERGKVRVAAIGSNTAGDPTSGNRSSNRWKTHTSPHAKHRHQKRQPTALKVWAQMSRPSNRGASATSNSFNLQKWCASHVLPMSSHVGKGENQGCDGWALELFWVKETFMCWNVQEQIKYHLIIS